MNPKTLSRTLSFLLVMLLLISMPAFAGKQASRDKDFSINSNAVITDRLTGLQWYVGPADITLHDANIFCQQLEVEGCGWRMPSINELQTLYTGSGKMTLEGYLPTIFNGDELKIWRVWANDTDCKSPVSFCFVEGTEDRRYGGSTPTLRVFAVRNPKEGFDCVEKKRAEAKKMLQADNIAQAWTRSSGGVISNTETGLQWFVGPNKVSWDQAVAFCRGLNVEGGGWRMPSLNELGALYTGKQNWDSHHSLPSIFGGVRMDIRCVWANKKENDYEAWLFTYPYGYEATYISDSHDESYRVFAVRTMGGSQSEDPETGGTGSSPAKKRFGITFHE